MVAEGDLVVADADGSVVVPAAVESPALARAVARATAESSVLAELLAGASLREVNDYAAMMLERLATHPNVGAVLLVSLGCEGFDRAELARKVARTGRPVEVLVVQQAGGTRSIIEAGRAWVSQAREQIADDPRADMALSNLVIGTICGGSDSTSGITANPAVGIVFDRLVEAGAIAIFEETGELIGGEYRMAERAITPDLGAELVAAVHKAEAY